MAGTDVFERPLPCGSNNPAHIIGKFLPYHHHSAAVSNPSPLPSKPPDQEIAKWG